MSPSETILENEEEGEGQPQDTGKDKNVHFVQALATLGDLLKHKEKKGDYESMGQTNSTEIALEDGEIHSDYEELFNFVEREFEEGSNRRMRALEILSSSNGGGEGPSFSVKWIGVWAGILLFLIATVTTAVWANGKIRKRSKKKHLE